MAQAKPLSPAHGQQTCGPPSRNRSGAAATASAGPGSGHLPASLTAPSHGEPSKHAPTPGAPPGQSRVTLWKPRPGHSSAQALHPPHLFPRKHHLSGARQPVWPGTSAPPPTPCWAARRRTSLGRLGPPPAPPTSCSTYRAPPPARPYIHSTWRGTGLFSSLEIPQHLTYTPGIHRSIRAERTNPPIATSHPSPL